MSKFSTKAGGQRTDASQANLTGLATMVSQLKADTQHKPGATLVPASVAQTVVAMEGYSDADVNDMTSALKGLKSSLESYFGGFQIQPTEHQKEAAMFGAALAADPKGSMNWNAGKKQQPDDNTVYVNPVGGDMFYETPMKKAMESYDERDNTHVTTYSTTYNLMASRQGPFAEMFFPTVIVAPDQVGFETTIRLNSVMSEVKSSIDGSAAEFNKKNLIQATINPDIFTPDQTKVVPVYRDESKAKFVDASLITPYDVLVDTEKVKSSAVKFGVRFGLMPISQSDALLKTGTIDYGDALDTNVELETVFVKLSGTVGGNATTEVFKVSTKRLPTAVFTKRVQGLDREMNLVFSNDAFTFTKDTKTAGGNASALLAVLGTNRVRVRLASTGTCNLQTSETQLIAHPIEVVAVLDENNERQPLDSGATGTAATLVNGGELIGFTLTAHRVNTNQRQRGQLLDTVYYNQVYTVPLRAPMSIPRPRTAGEENDAADLAALITATHIKINNAAIATLLEAAEFLEEYYDARDTFETQPAILGVARHLVTAYFKRTTIHLPDVIQSLTSSDKRENIQQAIVGVLRDQVFNAYRDSGWQAAADMLAGGDGGKPVILIGTDPVIASWLAVTGDNRLLGIDGYEVEVQSTLNKYMRGKMIVAFGQKNSTGKINPMHFGNMAYKPELTLVLPTYRNGQTSKELMVAPSYLHVVNCPIMMVFDVTGISQVASGQVPVPTKEAA